MGEIEAALGYLKNKIDSKEKGAIISFEEFLELVKIEPKRVLRNIFQLFHDMVKSYVPPGIDEYPDDPESIGYVKYDCSKIFSEGADNPFFPDRLFANRFIAQVDDLKRGSQQNRIHVYEGPPGCGKSTFLNNLLRKFEEYTSIREGQSFEIFWDIGHVEHREDKKENIEIPCPSHDHPILIIPKTIRAQFFDKLLSGETPEMKKIKFKIFNDKEYEWLFKAEACTICQSIFEALCEKSGNLDSALNMLKVRPYRFNRRLGEGISIFNPGDKPPPPNEMYFGNKQIQEQLDHIFGVNKIKYVFSSLAKTNGGIYVLMDIKSHNEERLLELHNVISEGVHKVGDIEERTTSLLLALMNPEDKESIKQKKVESFLARIQYGMISYVLEPDTEAKIYRSIFGDYIDSYFMPRVLSNFARIIISSRIGVDCRAIKEWIGDLSRYEKYGDSSGILLRMEIYSGVIPTWLSEDDKKNFTAQVRRKIIAEAESEGKKGFSGRDSIKLFSDFLSIYTPKHKLINMGHVVDFFKHRIGDDCRDLRIPKNFIDSLLKWYNFTVLNEVKEALYFYNRDQIREDILHFFWAITHNLGDRVRCPYTGKDIDVTIEFLQMMGAYALGMQMNNRDALKFAQETQKRYAAILASDPSKDITETDLYQNFFNSYVRNLKDKVLQPFLENENFPEAIKAFGSKEFDTFDTRLKEHVSYMIKNLISKFGYTELGAKEVCLYVLDKKIVEEFS